jgi:sulfate/thiosulfate-binding protein
MSKRKLQAALAGATLLTGSLSLILSGSPALASHLRDGTSLTLVAYSTPSAAYGALTAAFTKTKGGANVSFKTSYGASGDQSRAVANGLPADIVNFSLQPDMDRLVQAHLVDARWSKNQYKGMVTDSIVVFVVRPGNPKHVKTWSDLVKPGVDVITPNPFTSGGARWNVMAAYGSQIVQGKKPAQARAFLQKLFSHVSVQDTSARNELNTFVSGKGDVMLAYESEAINALQNGQNLQYIIPPQSILIENPLAVTTETKAPTQAKAFYSYLYSKAGQRIWGEHGYRPVRADVLKLFHFKKPKSLFTIGKFGGWIRVQTQFFDPNNSVMANIERGKGVAP